MSESATGLNQRVDEIWYGPVHRIEGTCDCCSKQVGIVAVVVGSVVKGNGSLQYTVGIVIVVFFLLFAEAAKKNCVVMGEVKKQSSGPFYIRPSSV